MGIRMSDQKEGKWLPYNQDGSQHDLQVDREIQAEVNIGNIVNNLYDSIN